MKGVGIAAGVVVALVWGAPLAAQSLSAEPQTPTGKFTTAVEVKPLLGATRKSWVAVREWEGQDLVYVTHLWAWRCGLVQVQISVNGDGFKVWPLPICHEGTNAPNAILDSDGLPYAVFPLKSVETLEVRLIYDDLSEDMERFTRADILLP